MRRPRFFLHTLLGVVIAAAACSSDQTTPMDPQPSLGLVNLVSGLLLKCSPQPYTSKTVVMGPEGGVLVFGTNALLVPRGALRQRTTIQGEVVTGTTNSVRFHPEGLRFEKSAALTMNYSNCSGVGMLLPKKIVYTDELLNLLELLKSVDLSGQKTVIGELKHFSRYAMAY